MSVPNKTVFISYAHEDAEFAERLYKDLKNAGLVPWLDKQTIRAGENWKIAIRKAKVVDILFLYFLLNRLKRLHMYKKRSSTR